MARNFHEGLRPSEIRPPSERSTGLVFAAVALLLAAIWRHHLAWAVSALVCAAVLAAFAFLAPQVLRPLNMLWFRFGLLLHKIVNPVVMLALFAIVFVPAGALMRLWHDPLRSRRKADEPSYWIERTEMERQEASMTNQF